jgi:hypothetical protein
MVKKIVSRQIYDTDTATRLHYREGHGGDRYQGLYQTPEGAFFFWEYDVGAGCGDIKLTTDEEAYQWLEEHANHLLGQYFLEGRAAKRRLTVQLPANLVRRLEALAAEKSLSLNSYLRRSLKQQCASAEQRASAGPPMVVRSRPKWLILDPNPFVDEATNVPEIVCKIMDEVYRALHNKSPRLAAMGARATLEHVMIDKVGDVGGFTTKLDQMEKDGRLSRHQRMDLDTILEAGSATIHRSWEPTNEHISTVLDITESLIESTYIHNERAASLARAVPPRPSRAKKT